jgi:hypothetical protein
LQVVEIEEQARLHGIHFAKPTEPLRLDVNGETIEFLFLAPFVGTTLCQFYLGYEGDRHPYEGLPGDAARFLPEAAQELVDTD